MNQINAQDEYRKIYPRSSTEEMDVFEDEELLVEYSDRIQLMTQDIVKQMSLRAGSDIQATNLRTRRTYVLPKESILLLSEFDKEDWWLIFACKIQF